jgi:hypothetical protein
MLEAAHENDIELEGMNLMYGFYSFVSKLMVLWIHLWFLIYGLCLIEHT